jgi:hypothetical protein
MPRTEEISPARSSPGCCSFGHLARVRRGALPLYQGYVAKRNEILGALDDVDLGRRTRSTRTLAR